MFRRQTESLCSDSDDTIFNPIFTSGKKSTKSKGIINTATVNTWIDLIFFLIQRAILVDHRKWVLEADFK